MIESLTVARLRLGDIEFRVEKHIDQNIVSWGEQTILKLSQQKAREKGLNSEVIAHLKIEKSGFCKIKLVWDYMGKDGKLPISVWLEDGTKAHPIPKDTNLTAKMLYFYWGKVGKYVTFKRVKHPGTKPMNICKDSIKEGKPLLSKLISQEVERYLRADSIK